MLKNLPKKAFFMPKHINIKISGRVQGVGFRFSAYEQFVDLGLVGKAENTQDGGVLIDVEGSDDKLEELLTWAKRGPTGAQVQNIEVSEMAEPFIPLKNG